MDRNKIVGIKRRLDQKNRIVIPSEYIEEFNIQKGQKLEMFLMTDGIYIKI